MYSFHTIDLFAAIFLFFGNVNCCYLCVLCGLFVQTHAECKNKNHAGKKGQNKKSEEDKQYHNELTLKFDFCFAEVGNV